MKNTFAIGQMVKIIKNRDLILNTNKRKKDDIFPSLISGRFNPNGLVGEIVGIKDSGYHVYFPKHVISTYFEEPISSDKDVYTWTIHEDEMEMIDTQLGIL
jgi:hypothetical protein